jgi:hypothetical protein
MPQFSWVFLFSRSPLLGSLCPTLKKCSSCSCGENLFPDECDPCLWRHVLPLSCRLKKPLDFLFFPLFCCCIHSHFTFLTLFISYPAFQGKNYTAFNESYISSRGKVLKREKCASSTFLTIFHFRFPYNASSKKKKFDMENRVSIARHFYFLKEGRNFPSNTR